MYIFVGNSQEITELLLHHEADPYVQDKDLFVPLSFAARYNRHRLAEVLLGHMLPIHCVTEIFDALMIAIECDHYAVIDVIISHIKQLDRYSQKIAYAVMHCVTECKHEIMAKLLTANVDLCMNDVQLTAAVGKNCVVCTRTLLEHLSACTEHEKDIPTFLLYITCKNKIKNNSPDKFTIVKMLLDHGLDLSTFSSEALHISAWLGNVSVVAYLLNHLRNNDKEMYKFAVTQLLPLACENWQNSIVSMLLCRGADYTPRIVDGIWQDFLIHMSNFNNASSRVSAIFYVYTQSLTAYSKSFGYKAYDIIENLLIHGADPNKISIDNNVNYCLSSMFNETRYYYKTMLKLLLQAGFDPNTLVDVSNEPAVLYCVKKKYFCTSAMLALSGADMGCLFSRRDINMITNALSHKERKFVQILNDNFSPASLKVNCRRKIRKVIFQTHNARQQQSVEEEAACLSQSKSLNSITSDQPEDVLQDDQPEEPCVKCSDRKEFNQDPYWIRLFSNLMLPNELTDYLCLHELEDLVTNDTIVQDWTA